MRPCNVCHVHGRSTLLSYIFLKSVEDPAHESILPKPGRQLQRVVQQNLSGSQGCQDTPYTVLRVVDNSSSQCAHDKHKDPERHLKSHAQHLSCLHMLMSGMACFITPVVATGLEATCETPVPCN